MIRVLTLLLLAPVIAGAAPVPPESDRQKVARLWGEPRVPSGSYRVKPEGDHLTLRTIGWPVAFDYRRPEFQVTREVAGDFDVRVKLYSLDPPARGIHYEGSPQTAAGLYIDGGDCTVALYRWMALHTDHGRLQEGMQDSPWLSRRTRNAGSGSMLGAWEAGKSGHLRVIRKGDQLTAMTSFDGANWKEHNAAMGGLKLPDAVTVGLFVGHTTSQQCSATFAEFTIEKPK